MTLLAKDTAGAKEFAAAAALHVALQNALSTVHAPISDAKNFIIGTRGRPTISARAFVAAIADIDAITPADLTATARDFAAVLADIDATTVTARAFVAQIAYHDRCTGIAEAGVTHIAFFRAATAVRLFTPVAKLNFSTIYTLARATHGTLSDGAAVIAEDSCATVTGVERNANRHIVAVFMSAL
jgi:hypothetical protein